MINKDWGAIAKTVKQRKFDLIYSAILHAILKHKDHEGFSVVDEEGDNLIVLDSCRFDAFEKVNNIPGKLDKKTSKGTTTIQRLNQNFTEYYGDIVYLSTVAFVDERPTDANYQEKRFEAKRHFHQIERVRGGKGIENGAYISPEETTNAAKKFVRKYPDKRKIIHYSQPHLPFVTDDELSKEKLSTYSEYLRKGYSWQDLKRKYEESLRRVRREHCDNCGSWRSAW